ncbi:hypothetical protein C1H46_012579 [Malus baccata]|uniref:AMP-dependent synthetase/ligase domain-containing protein n=1 Tax=Malus baccata TaxID=106549 RepID=A0A540MSL0_MALBA|nr:hypothetical protein C1H46_012579 [Malus baccata]
MAATKYKYLVEVEKAKEAKDGRPSQGPVYRSLFAKDGFPPAIPGMDSCWDVFRMSVEKNPGNPMLGRREIVNGKAGKYVWLTYKEVYDVVVKVGNAIRSCGVGEGDKCGIYGVNCPEWIMSMEACNAHGLYCVPLYDTLGAGAVEFIICHAEVSIDFYEEKKIPELLKAFPGAAKYLKTLVSFGNVTPEQKETLEQYGVALYSWSEFLQLVGLTHRISSGGFVKKTMFNLAYSYKYHNMQKGHGHAQASPIADKVVFSKVKQGLGGRVRLILSGAAPLSTHVEAFLRVVACAHVLQGYGLTETCAGTFVSLPNELSMLGTVGPPVPNVDVCLESVPEMGYDALSDTPCGEVCVRGNTLFSGYYKREDLTKEVLIDGWFHTGDVGEWQPDGSLKIIDRKKNIFKLSQGEYVAVENLENIYGLVSDIDAIWVYGNSFESFLVAVVNPNKQAIECWAQQNGISGDFNSLCGNAKVKEHILGELNKIAKEKKLKGFEVIRGVHLDPEPFDMERDLITPTYKKKRPQLLKHYKCQRRALAPLW